VADTWTLHLAAKVPDEAEIVRRAIDVDLVP
jgi:hypothetical protein